MILLRPCLIFLAAVDARTYRAAVADMSWGQTDAETLTRYSSLTQNAKAAGAQIIVFPEAMTWGDETRKEARDSAQAIPAEGSLPCEAGDASSFKQVRSISCMARENGIVVVANVLDKIACSGKACPKDGLLIYNTAIALNETGHLLAVYHKRHDYSPLDQPPLLAKSFVTSFGVEFGLIVCYDMDFITPVRELIAQGVRNFAFSTDWYNEVPLQTATLSQQGWSHWHGANLLASNAATDLTTAGSGIYSAGDVLASKFDVDGDWPAAHSFLIANVPVVPAHKPMAVAPPTTPSSVSSTGHKDGVACSIDADDAAAGTCASLPAGSLGAVNLSVTDGAVQCAAQMDIAVANSERYVLFASAWRVSDTRVTDLDVCALMVCQQKGGKGKKIRCKPAYNGSLILRSLSLEMSTSTAKVMMPFVGVGKSENLPREAFHAEVASNSFRLSSGSSWTAIVDNRGLLTAALYGTDASAPDLSQSASIV